MITHKQELEKVQPASNRAYLHTAGAGAGLPLAQALISGLMAGLLVLVICIISRSRYILEVSGLAMLLVTAGVWYLTQRHWFSLTDVERLTGMDLNRDGNIGEPAPEVRVVIDRIKENGHFEQSRTSLPASQEQMQSLAQGILEYHLPFTVREWTGRGRPFSVEQFNRLRGELMRRGLIEAASEKDARRGFVFTPEGEQVLQGFLSV